MTLERLIDLIRQYDLLDASLDLESALEQALSAVFRAIGESEWDRIVDPEWRSRRLLRDAVKIQRILEYLTQEEAR